MTFLVRFISSSTSWTSPVRLESRLPGRLVGEQDLRVVDQGPGHGHALHLPAGELARQMAAPLGQAQVGQQPLPVGLGPVLAVEGERQQHVFQHRQGRHQMEALEHVAEDPPADARELRLGEYSGRPRISPGRRAAGSPELGLSRQPRMLTKVVLPEPEGPTKETNSPFLISSETPSRAAISSLPRW